MATIKAIESRSVHQIQSGQVIIDLCSVVKELVENSLDAGAKSIDVRFKNYGLEAIEVQDNGVGISPDNFETIALKHYTSKLSTYEDLSCLDTFGFRGEALSSLCALSKFHILTARDGEAPRGTRLDFEMSGKLSGFSVGACRKGTTVVVENLFYNLPVRRKELEKNIKREYSKVLSILHAYACISSGIRFTVSNQAAKAKKTSIFSTTLNSTIGDNIANIYGSKTLLALIPLSLDLELASTTTNHVVRDIYTKSNKTSRQVSISGYVSRPLYGEGRQTPDRQMFFVNSRPCGLPQVAKVFNEVYKSYNSHQSPFIFANLRMDTNAYDVNVSPDKRTILLHDQTALLDSIRSSLTHLFEAQDQTMPQSQLQNTKFTPSRGGEPILIDTSSSALGSTPYQSATAVSTSLIQKFCERDLRDRQPNEVAPGGQSVTRSDPSKDKQKLARKLDSERQQDSGVLNELEDATSANVGSDTGSPDELSKSVPKFKTRLAFQQAKLGQGPVFARSHDYQDTHAHPAVIGTAIIRRNSETSTTVNRSGNPGRHHIHRLDREQKYTNRPASQFAQVLRAFAAPGTQIEALNASIKYESDSSPERKLSEWDEIGQRLEQTAESLSKSDVNSPEALAGVENVSHPVLVQTRAEPYDDDFVDEEERKVAEQARVQEMVRQAEIAATVPLQGKGKRMANLLTRTSKKDSTVHLIKVIETSLGQIQQQVSRLHSEACVIAGILQEVGTHADVDHVKDAKVSAEERLSLTISKSDFFDMRVAGQFNLGFILATRPQIPSVQGSNKVRSSDDLFIIDQHASDEIFNFHRLSDTTVLTPQPLLQPQPLELTAIEEETVLSHASTLAKNGFNVAMDMSGDSAIGRRCTLLSLPTSRETVFDTRDLEELLALLSDTAESAAELVRPSKVRKILAMRACRSSVMVGKTLSQKGMEGIVRHMGEIERPWNCPHGRPTMRHLARLGDWSGWQEGDGLLLNAEEREAGRVEVDWAAYGRARRDNVVGHATRGRILQTEN